MQLLHDPKRMARVLREKLQAREIALSHSECLEIVAAQFGAHDWNTLAAAGRAIEPAQNLALPDGWFVGGRRHDLFAAGIDAEVEWQGQRTIVIRNLPANGADPVAPEHFASLTQIFSANEFRGKRLGYSAWLKGSDIAGSGTLWMRIEDASRKIVAFDNMEGREAGGSLHGSHDWVQRHIALDVPETAASIHFGVYLAGAGALWCAAVEIAPLATDAPATAQIKLRAAPENLSFAATGKRRRGYGFGPRAAPVQIVSTTLAS